MTVNAAKRRTAMGQPQEPLHNIPTNQDGAASDTRKPWMTPQLRILPVPSVTQGGPQPKKPMEKVFYKTTS